MARTKSRPECRASTAPRAERPAQRSKSKMTAATTAETSATGAKANTEKAIADVTPTCKSARISEKRARKAKAAAEAAATVGHITPAIATAAGDDDGEEYDL